MSAPAQSVPGELDLELYQGDDAAFVLQFDVDEFPLVGAVASSAIRRYLGSSVSVLPTCRVDEALNRIEVLISGAQSSILAPGQSVWDLQVLIAGAVRTLVAGSVNVRAQVTL